MYTALVYITAPPGVGGSPTTSGVSGKAIWVGGWIIAARPLHDGDPDELQTFFLGLVFIICGTGLLKPNVSTIVGDLYPDGGARRDAGFSVFYMGINLGAFFGPLITGRSARREGYHWHWGFGDCR